MRQYFFGTIMIIITIIIEIWRFFPKRRIFDQIFLFELLFLAFWLNIAPKKTGNSTMMILRKVHTHTLSLSLYIYILV
jgi:hypothetical protein